MTLAALTLATAFSVSNVMPAGRRRGRRDAAGQAAATEAGVRDTLQRYSAALESLDANAVKKVQPSIPVDSLAKAFKDMRELKVGIDDIRVLSADGTTRV